MKNLIYMADITGAGPHYFGQDGFCNQIIIDNLWYTNREELEDHYFLFYSEGVSGTQTTPNSGCNQVLSEILVTPSNNISGNSFAIDQIVLSENSKVGIVVLDENNFTSNSDCVVEPINGVNKTTDPLSPVVSGGRLFTINPNNIVGYYYTADIMFNITSSQFFLQECNYKTTSNPCLTSDHVSVDLDFVSENYDISSGYNFILYKLGDCNETDPSSGCNEILDEVYLPSASGDFFYSSINQFDGVYSNSIVDDDDIVYKVVYAQKEKYIQNSSNIVQPGDLIVAHGSWSGWSSVTQKVSLLSPSGVVKMSRTLQTTSTSNRIYDIKIDYNNQRIFICGRILDSTNSGRVGIIDFETFTLQTQRLRDSDNTSDITFNGNIYCLEIDTNNNLLWVGGTFTDSGRIRIASFNLSDLTHNTTFYPSGGCSWGGGIWVLKFDKQNNFLYVGGGVTSTSTTTHNIGGEQRIGIARLDLNNNAQTDSWYPAGGIGTFRYCYDIELIENDVILGGTFDNRLMVVNRDDDTSISILSSLFSSFSNIRTLKHFTQNSLNNLYVGGSFSYEIGGSTHNALACLDVSGGYSLKQNLSPLISTSTFSINNSGTITSLDVYELPRIAFSGNFQAIDLTENLSRNLAAYEHELEPFIIDPMVGQISISGDSETGIGFVILNDDQYSDFIVSGCLSCSGENIGCGNIGNIGDIGDGDTSSGVIIPIEDYSPIVLVPPLLGIGTPENFDEGPPTGGGGGDGCGCIVTITQPDNCDPTMKVEYDCPGFTWTVDGVDNDPPKASGGDYTANLQAGQSEDVTITVTDNEEPPCEVSYEYTLRKPFEPKISKPSLVRVPKNDESNECEFIFSFEVEYDGLLKEPDVIADGNATGQVSGNIGDTPTNKIPDQGQEGKKKIKYEYTLTTSCKGEFTFTANITVTDECNQTVTSEYEATNFCKCCPDEPAP